ncbi:Npc2f [Drosophila busckii]|uniref:Npc2f n=1 Tax=Drosophila busckii TaxID=30019 RepID=A0A0M4EL66_DROBS|nr:NPC intracellular cholesterol transporter 2 isoform X2 [Drosophila busckii]ALC45977.1 Npc2f [Drosophila busckii]
MRSFFVYYLKILWLIALAQQLTGSAIKTTSEKAYKKLMSLRSLAFEDCGSLYKVNYLNIDGCSKTPCPMARNSSVKVTVLFDDNGNGVSFLKHEVSWLFTYSTKAAVITPDPCDGDHHCLVSLAEGKSYWANIFVTPTLPIMRGNMKWEGLSETKQTLICFEVPVVITL